MQEKFTDRFIKSIPFASSGQDDFVDSTALLAGVPGHLGLKVGKQKRTWYIRYRIAGKRRSMKLGFYPALSLAEARKSAITKLTEVSNGTDPRQKVMDYKVAPTVTDLWAEYQKVLKRQRKPKTPITMKEELRKWEEEIKPKIGMLKVEDVTPLILANLLDKKADAAPVSANRLYSLLSVLFKPALRLGWIKVHPLQWVSKPGGQEIPRKRVLSDDEIKILWQYFDKLMPTPRDILKLGLLTAQRPGEISKMQWQDIDLTEGTWTQPNTKNGSIHITPLVGQSLNIFLERYQGEIDGYVFPSRGVKNKVPYAFTTKCARATVIKKSGITGWTAHDLRRTARTIMSRLRIDQHIRERVLNHSQSGVVGVYDQYDYLDEKRDALNKLDRELSNILSV